ncbi:MAG: hypothetical protein IJI05_00300, partial [Erysipelotrichaceae bacterium]|nr:hypothetical protein [Erysipelotrichaceae bacterium]
PLWENHVFKGWNPEVASEVNSSMADGNRAITYKAQWKDDKNGNKIADDEESFTVKYDLNGAPSEAGVTYTYTDLHLNDRTPVISDPKWNGKTFQGWKPEVAPKILAENSDVSSVITYVADWEPDIACIQRGELIFKYKSVAAALADAQSGDTIRMLMDAEENDIACKNASFILDLNGFTLKTTGFAVSGSMDITLKNSSSKKGKLQLTSSGPTSGLVPDASKKVIMTVDGAVIESEGLLLYSTGKGSAVRIISGEIVCAGAMQNEDTYCGAISGSGIEEVTISGGSLKVRKGQAIWLGKGSGTVTITGGYVSAELEVVRAAKQLDVSGGTLVGNGTDNDGTS